MLIMSKLGQLYNIYDKIPLEYVQYSNDPSTNLLSLRTIHNKYLTYIQSGWHVLKSIGIKKIINFVDLMILLKQIVFDQSSITPLHYWKLCTASQGV